MSAPSRSGGSTRRAYGASVPTPKLPKLPDLIQQKLPKTGYTRGASTKEIYQNRVTRNNTVLIPRGFWDLCRPTDTFKYENGFIVLVDPTWYFNEAAADERLQERGLWRRDPDGQALQARAPTLFDRECHPSRHYPRSPSRRC